MKKIYSLIVALMATTGAFAQWTDQNTGVTYTVVDGTDLNANEGAKKACDGNVNTKLGTNAKPAFLTIEASEPVSCVGYAITTGGDNAQWTGRNPEDWVLEGCNDLELEEWDIIDEVVADQVLQDVNCTEFTFEVTPSPRYKYFRYTVNKVEGGGFLQFSEFHILGAVDHHWVLVETVPATCTEWGYFHYECSDGDGATRDEVNPNDPPTGVHVAGADGFCTCGHLMGTLAALPVTEGYNADVVCEELPAEEHLVLGIDNATTGFATESVAGEGQGLPDSGVIETLGGYTVNVVYTETAHLRMGDSNEYTLTVEPVKAYGLHILGSSAAGASTTKVTVVYDDDTTSEASFSWADWFGGEEKGVALARIKRVYNGGCTEGPSFRLFEDVVKVDATKAIAALKFQQTGEIKTPVIMAISYAAAGDTNAISNVNAVENNRIYNLQGIEVKSAQKGLYIINGKKVQVK